MDAEITRRPDAVKTLPRTVLTFQSRGQRPLQEDAVFSEPGRGIFGVLDGFGGTIAGKKALEITEKSVLAFLQREAGDLDATFPFVIKPFYSVSAHVVFNALVYANRELYRWNKNRPVGLQGGVSSAVCLAEDGRISISGVGSNQIWLCRAGKWVPLVLPQSYAFQVDPTEQRRDQEHFQIPWMSLGLAEDFEPEIRDYWIQPGDVIWIQTDGVSTQTRALMQQKILEADPNNLKFELDSLWSAAFCEDNASLLLLRF